jgi:amino acid efflux transporter
MSNNNKIGVATATIVGMNAMIGSGIFGIPAALASHVGPAGIITTLFVAVIVWCLALSLSRVAKIFPMEGSFYNYAKQFGGHTLGVLANSAYFIGLLIAMGLLTKMSGVYWQHHFPQYSQFTLSILTLGSLILLNIFGVKMSQLGQMILICTTVAPLILTSIICLSKASFNNLIPFAPFGYISVLQASKIAIFSFFGFESAASLFGVVKNPEKNVPKALSYSLLIVAIIYIIFSASIILAIPLNLLKDPMVRLTDVLAQIFPNSTWIINAINISILSAILGTIHSMIWGSSQLLISFVKELKSAFAKKLINEKILNSTTSVLFIGACIFTSFTLIQNADLFFNLTAIFLIFAYSTSIFTLLSVKHKSSLTQHIITIVGLLAAALIFIFAVQGLFIEILKLTH